MKVLIAPDKFKGSIEAYNVATAIKDGLKVNYPKSKFILHPMADGGDGTIEIIALHNNALKTSIKTFDPLFKLISSHYYIKDHVAYIELAISSGLSLLSESEKNPLLTSTYGTGQIIKDAISKSCTDIFLCLGGSATNDCGIGIAAALDCIFKDKNGNKIMPIGKNLIHIETIELNSNMPKFTILCDVENTLSGPNGATYVFGKQKGADENELNVLEKGVVHFANIIQQQFGKDINKIKGGGAAGGVAAGLSIFAETNITSGFDTVSELTGLEQKVKYSDIIITGEGQFDHQSLNGKVIGGMLALAKKYKKPMHVITGQNKLSKIQYQNMGISSVNEIISVSKDLPDAIGNAKAHITNLATKIVFG